ncbi:MAG: hypothetical protein QUV20_14240 [Oceanibaculum nanhaiense]|uniref:hypothetical protein n=1 Tax=Oceanibaculum nanhaiense TaxID=1909734 RepID=UPI0025A32C7E|nr:hypothetical protein [Oceanibaculum nanhaiense]MDM7947481.1 hypothetical protein [Oceanibaculum nanhaiense]
MTASSPTLPVSLLRAALALAVLAGLLLGIAHPPTQPQAVTSTPQTAILELGGGTFGPTGHVLAEDFRQVQHRLAENAPAAGDDDAPFLLATAISVSQMPAPARLSTACFYRPASQTPDRHRPTGPPRLLS